MGCWKTVAHNDLQRHDQIQNALLLWTFSELFKYESEETGNNTKHSNETHNGSTALVSDYRPLRGNQANSHLKDDPFKGDSTIW